MAVRLHPHALMRLRERGATEAEVVEAVRSGESFPAKFGRTGFRRNFVYNSRWQGKTFATKQVEVIVVPENEDWLAITVIVRFF